MLKLIYGPPGSGKTFHSDALALSSLREGKKVVLLVPEQEAIEAENRIYDKAISSGTSIERLTVVSFRRLANLAFRKHGGIEYGALGDSGKLVLLWRSIEELAPLLKCYKDSRDRSFVELMLSVCEELKRYGVSPSDVSNASDSVGDSAFSNKLHDVALIYAFYTSQMHSYYSDSIDDINRLAEILRTEKPDSSEVYYVDSFNGFTAPEFAVLSSLIKYCDVTVTLNRFQKDGKAGFLTVEKTEKELLKIAKDSNSQVKILMRLEDSTDLTSPEFSLIKDKLYEYSYTSNPEHSSDKIDLAVCKDPFSEAEYVAIKISKLVRAGARYRDFAVITRGSEKLEGVLDVVFEKYDIPLFLSKRNPLTSAAVYRAVSSALEIITSGFSTEDVFAYINSGVCGFSLEEIDLIESYVVLWNINGKRWTEDEDWLMNPNGFVDQKSADTDEKLQKINDIRRKIILPIKELAEDISGADALSAAKAIYCFISKSGITEYFSKADENEEVTAYNTFISLLESLVTVIGDIPVNARVLSSLLYLMAKNTDYGKIPSSFDRVTAGDASMLRCNGVKHVFLIGCQSGQFPATVTDDSFFSDNEKDSLRKLGISLSPDINEKNDLESFYFLRSAGGATETLTATYCESSGKLSPSVGFQRLQALFPANVITKYPQDLDVTERIQTIETSKEILSALYGTKTADTLKELYSELNISAELNPMKISEPDVTVSKETVDKLFSGNINLTPSRLEGYVKCPFSYYCNNVLKLKEKKYNYFMSSDMGTYIHRILEKAVELLCNLKPFSDITDDDVSKAIDDSIKEVLFFILGAEATAEKSCFEALIIRLRRSLILITQNIVSEFRKSKFRPKFFEFKIGNSEAQASPLKFKLDDGTSISVYGTIDRVDTYSKDGKVYVRVVDYKSGSREHSIDNLKYGLDAQMLVYLFSICQSENKEFLQSLGVLDNTNVIPAGVLYQPARLKVSNQDTPTPYDQALELADHGLKRKGVLLDDEEILTAMEEDLAGKFMPVSRGSNGNLKAGANVLISIDGFGELYNTIESTFIDIGKMMRSGNGCASPLKTKSTDACRSCSFSTVCRSKHLFGTDDAKEGGND